MRLNRELLSKSGNSVYNDETRLFLAANVQSWFQDPKAFSLMVDLEGFVSDFRKWILSSKSNRVLGLESFEVACVSLGVTQALDQFHADLLLNGRRLRMLRGEYPYSREVHPFSTENDFIDDHPIIKGDAVVMSCPFSATGDIHPRMNEILDTCEKLKVPVFLDLAWFGTCGGLTIDLRHPAIQSVAFSLTKGLTCGNYRSGVRWTRRREDLSPKDRLLLQHRWNHSIHLNLKIGRELMKNFGPDTQFEKYRKAQLEICETFELQPSPCVHIATSMDPIWNEFNRDGYVNRINLRDAIKKHLSFGQGLQKL